MTFPRGVAVDTQAAAEARTWYASLLSLSVHPTQTTLPPHLLTQLAETIPLNRCSSPSVLHNRTASSLGHAVPPKERSKLSINFLSSAHPLAEGSTSPPQRSPALSSRARGVNRPDPVVNGSEDVEVATEGSSDGQSRYPSLPLRIGSSHVTMWSKFVYRSYRLEIVQHPHRAAEFGASALTRLPLAPPLIAQLVMRDSAGRTVTE